MDDLLNVRVALDRTWRAHPCIVSLQRTKTCNMLRTSLVLTAVCSCLLGSAQNVTIVESQSNGLGQTMDTLWNWVAANMGYTPTIVQQSALDNLANLSGTDILIISSGIIDHSGTTHSATVSEFVLSGRPVFVQSEYLSTYSTNIMFDEVMTAVGADFAWSVTVDGDQAPVTVSGDLATTPNAVPPLDYFWYGCSGGGTGVESFLSSAGSELGWVYRDPLETNGTVITTSDEDWVLQNYSPELMENILTMLMTGIHAGVQDQANSPLPSAYPIPFTERLTFTMPTDGLVDLTINDMSGRLVLKRSFTRSVELDTEDLGAGAYVYRIRQGNGRAAQGILVKR
jgi:hypothetical protein